MSITKLVTGSIDRTLNSPKFKAFSRLEKSEGHSFRRYYCRNDAAESEISVYRDKRWSKAGGVVNVELFCLVADYQRASGGCDQSWLSPDCSRPLRYFQYSVGADARDTQQKVSSTDDAKTLESWLHEFLVTEALPWFANLETCEGVTAHLERERDYLGLVKWVHHLGELKASLSWLKLYLLERPPRLEETLSDIARIGLISDEERRKLERGSMQEVSTFEATVREWADSRGA